MIFLALAFYWSVIIKFSRINRDKLIISALKVISGLRIFIILLKEDLLRKTILIKYFYI